MRSPLPLRLASRCLASPSGASPPALARSTPGRRRSAAVLLPFALLAFALLLAVLCSLAGCRTAASDEPAPQPEPLRFLALGDSYTIGEGEEASARWPVQLVEVLEREHGLEVAPPEIIARTGWSTAQLAAGLERAAPQGTWHLVTVMIGVNNQYRGGELETYRAELRELLERAIALGGGEARRVVVVSIPDWGASPFARAVGADAAEVAAEIDAFNEVARAEAEASGVVFVDVTPYSREAGTDAAMFVADGLHPSQIQYAGWVDRILPAAARALRPGEAP